MAAYTLTKIKRLESGTPEGLRVTVTYHLTPATPAARTAAYADFLGGIRLVNGVLRYRRPMQDAVFPWCYCNSINAEPIEEDQLQDTADSASAYNSDLLVVTATFEPKTAESDDSESGDKPDTSDTGDQPQEVDTLRREWDFSVRSLSLPNQWMRWGTTRGPGDKDVLIGNDGVAATKTVPQIDYVITRFFVRNKPADAVTALMGRVNKTDFWLYGERYRPETLRLDSAKDTQRVTNFGVKFFEMSYKFAIQPTYDSIVETVDPVPDAGGNAYVGWNRVFNPRVCKWERIVWQADPTRGTYLHDEDAPAQTIRGKEIKGFNLLFNPGAK